MHGDSQCTIERDRDDIAWLGITPAAPVATLTRELIDDLLSALDTIHGEDPAPRGIIIHVTRPDSFLVGRGVAELETLLDAEKAEALIDRGQRLTGRLARIKVPTVALIRGRCHDAGLELAVACRYRVAETAAALGFPEVHLGLHPCYGGSGRLVELLGAHAALKLLTSGQAIDAREAAGIGLVDAVADNDALTDAARDLVLCDPGRHSPVLRARVRSHPFVRWSIQRLQWTRGEQEFVPQMYPATEALTRLERKQRGQRMSRWLDAERASIHALLKEHPTRNYIRSFLLRERLVRESAAAMATPPQRVHVIGAGHIGTEITAWLVHHGIAASLHDHDPDTLAHAEERIGRRIADLGNGKTPAELTIDPEGEGLAGADYIIEAIDEDADSKRELLAAIEPRLRDDAIIASTSATVPPQALAEALQHRARFIGLHILQPLSSTAIAELLAADATGDETMECTRALVRSLGRIPLEIGHGTGSIVWRLLMAYLMAGARIFERPRRELIDFAARRFGMPRGPLELADTIGLDVCLRHGEAMRETTGIEPPEALRERVAEGHFGERTNAGFHDWRNGQHVHASLPPGQHPFDEIARSLIDPVLEQARQCRDEGVLIEEDRLDAGAILGFGFPAWTGGPLNHLGQCE